LGEPRWSVDVPDPRLAHRHLEVRVAGLRAHLHVDGVAEVEATIGLDDVLEVPGDIAVLAIERELHLGFVAFEVVGAHRCLPRDRMLTGSPSRPWCRRSPRPP